jgi:hypothetical protein
MLDIECQAGDKDIAWWWQDSSGEGVRVTPRQNRPYTAAAALDVIAHEWGHGLVHATAGADSFDDELNEGFADVVGYSVEWLQQAAGSGYERADWKFYEDDPPMDRRVDVDDGVGGYSYHKNDDADPAKWPHGPGNRLPVALRLLSDGGHNPLVDSGRCNTTTMPGCDTEIAGVGIEDASKILVRTLTVYCTSSTAWEDLANLAKKAAYDLFRHCSFCESADYEQQAVLDAFQAIGYPGSVALWHCIGCP